VNNPLALFRSLRDLYIRYLDSPFDLRYPDLVRERRRLLDRDGYLWREPLIEPVPAYQPCGTDFGGMVQATLAETWDNRLKSELAEFIGCGAFRPDLQPYEHRSGCLSNLSAMAATWLSQPAPGPAKPSAFSFR
jgi:DEAD/DEAH box helicase domain-containing protein